MPNFLSLFFILFLTACSSYVQEPEISWSHSTKISNGYFYTYDGTRLPLKSWGHQKHPYILIALHGFNDYSNFIEDSAKTFAQHGIQTFAIDQRGFGQTNTRGYWSSTESMIKDVYALLKELHKQYPNRPIYLFGESMGGAVALLTSTTFQDAPVSGLILSAPAVWGWATMPWYQRWALSFAHYTFPWMTFTGKGLNIKPSDNIPMLIKLGKDANMIRATRVDAMYGLTQLMGSALEHSHHIRVPTLILYGEKDEIIPKEPTSMMIERLPKDTDITLALYENGYHMLLRDLQGKVVLRDILAWIKEQPLPSGANQRSIEKLLN